jgi:hypothetical protein
MLVRGIGIRDISVVLCVSITTVLNVLTSAKYTIKPKQNYYNRLEIDEFWTYVGKKQGGDLQSMMCNSLYYIELPCRYRYNMHAVRSG